jgi:hypothetical protein
MKDGTEIKCPSVYGDGRPGQVVVLMNVCFEKIPDLEKWPFGAYPQPSFFTILEKLGVEKYSLWYLVRDVYDKEFKCEFSIGIYDAQVWGQWNAAKQKEDSRQKNARIQHIEAQVALLRGILVDQGIKVITPEQAKTLGIK